MPGLWLTLNKPYAIQPLSCLALSASANAMPNRFALKPVYVASAKMLRDMRAMRAEQLGEESPAGRGVYAHAAAASPAAMLLLFYVQAKRTDAVANGASGRADVRCEREQRVIEDVYTSAAGKCRTNRVRGGDAQ